MGHPDNPLWRQLRRARTQHEDRAPDYTTVAQLLIAQTAAQWITGTVSPQDLLCRYDELSDSRLPNLDQLWLDAMPGVTYTGLLEAVHGTPKTLPDREWTGTWPVTKNMPMPERYHPVAYCLIDHVGRVAYAGSTQWFLDRMRQHASGDKGPDLIGSWWCRSCPDRQAARQGEQDLMDEYDPYLNQKRAYSNPSRRWSAPPDQADLATSSDVASKNDQDSLTDSGMSLFDLEETPQPAQDDDTADVASEINNPDVGVPGYWRERFGKREFVRTHKRGPRSKSPGGYQQARRADEAS